MNLETMLEQYRVDRVHARRVADHALTLFDAVAERYGLAPAGRRLLEIGALVHNVGLTTDPPAHHVVGRDIVLRHEIDGLDAQERALVAALVVFHRKRVRARQEPAYLSLDKRRRREALRLAAILRVADGLDYAHTQTTAVEEVVECPGGLALRLSGAQAGVDGPRAVAKADLWAKTFGEALSAEGPGGAPLPAPPEEAEEAEAGEGETAQLTPWYTSSEIALAELGRVLLRRHLARFLDAERRVRIDRDIEAVHGLRVATRRLRATIRLLEPVGPRSLRGYSRAAARVARAASAVRDRDVLLADLATRLDTMPEALRPAAEELRAALEAERRDAHRCLVRELDSDDHAAFVQSFAATMCSAEGWDDHPRVRDLGGSTIWRHYEALRAHDRGGLPQDDEELHAMRIDGKRLRYVLELFADTLGPRTDEAVVPLTAFQDHLGGLNDIAVARGILMPHTRDKTICRAVADYLAIRDEQGGRLRSDLPARWEKLSSATYRRRLMELVVRL